MGKKVYLNPLGFFFVGLSLMNYPLYNLDDSDFEDLVTLICQKILGMGTIVFATGKDA